MRGSDLNKIAEQHFSLCTKTNEQGRKKEKLIVSFLEIQANLAEKKAKA